MKMAELDGRHTPDTPTATKPDALLLEGDTDPARGSPQARFDTSALPKADKHSRDQLRISVKFAKRITFLNPDDPGVWL